MTLVPLGEPSGRTRWEVEHDGRRLLVLRHEDAWVVTDALCPHRQGRLVEGVVRGDSLVCPSHWYTFDLHTGACRTTPLYRLGVFDVVERDATLYAEVPDRPRRSWADVLHAHARGE